MQDPSVHDAVALIVPADADPRDTAPVKHRWATESKSHLTNGSGSMRCGSLASLCLHATTSDFVKQHLIIFINKALNLQDSQTHNRFTNFLASFHIHSQTCAMLGIGKICTTGQLDP